MAAGTLKYKATLKAATISNYQMMLDRWVALGLIRDSHQYQQYVNYIHDNDSCTFAVTMEGTPLKEKYTVKDATVEFDVKNASVGPFTLEFTGINSKGSKVALGNIHYSGAWVRGQKSLADDNKLCKDPVYHDLKSINIKVRDTSEIRILGGAFTLTVNYNVTEPIVYEPKIKNPVVITGVKESKGIVGESRNTSLKVTIEGVDISEDVNKYLLGMTYTDNEEDATDDLQIQMHDKDGQWLQKWLDETIQTAAMVRYQRTTSTVSTAVISDSAANYSPLQLMIQTNAYQRMRGGNYAIYNYSGREYDVVMLQKYLKLLGYYKGDLNGSITEDMCKALFSWSQNSGSGGVTNYSYNRTNYTQWTVTNVIWGNLIAAVNGKVDTLHAVVFTTRKEMTLYSGANTSSAKIATVKRNTDIQVTGKSGTSWYKAEYGGETGYIAIDSTALQFSKVEAITKTVSKISTKGLNIQAGIILRTPDGKQRQLNCGEFTLDSVGSSGPPSAIHIKGTSAPYSNGVRTVKRSKAWTNCKLSGIGQEIAKKAGLGYLFDSENNPTYSRVEQSDQTDLAFLMDLCHRNGCSLKVSDKKLIIFEQSRYEKMDAAATVTFMDGSYTNYNLTTEEGENHYTGCIVRYYDPKAKKIYTATVMADDADKDSKDGNYLTVTNEPVSSNEEAKALANARLRLCNKFEKKVTLTMLGNPGLAAGLPMRLKGWGLFDGKYTIRQARHQVDTGGYITQITLRAIPDVTTAKGSLTSVTEALAKKIAVPVEPKENTGTEFKTNQAVGVYNSRNAYRYGDASGVRTSLAINSSITVLGQERDGVLRISSQLSPVGQANQTTGSIKQVSGYIRADAIERTK